MNHVSLALHLSIRFEASTATTIPATISSSWHVPAASAPAEASSTTPSASSASSAAAHAGEVGALGYHLDIASLEDALVEYECLRDKTGLGEFDIRITAATQVSMRHDGK